jgi:hypothetical protein
VDFIPMLLAAIRISPALLACLLLLLPARADAQSDNGNAISLIPGAAPALNLRLQGGLSDDLIRRIAKVGEPSSVEVTAGESAKVLAETKCGNSRRVYMQLVLGRNRALQVNAVTYNIAVAGTLDLPACAYVEQNVRVTPEVEQDRAALLTDATGYSGPKTLDAFRRENPRFPRQARTAAAGQTIILPYRSRITTIKLLPRHASDPSAELDEVKALLESAMHAEAAPIGRLIPVAARGSFQDATNQRCPPPVADTGAPPKPWPFAATAFRDAFARAAAESEALGLQAPQIIVGILDSGFPYLPAAPFVDARLLRKPGLTTFDRYGISGAVERMPPFAEPGDPDADHGTMVAVLALGGTEFMQEDTAGISRIRLRLERLVDPSSGGELYEGFLLKGIADALAHGATILNASFEFPSKLDSVLQAMAAHRNVLMVVAAGNDGRLPARTPRYPANMAVIEARGCAASS